MKCKYTQKCNQGDLGKLDVCSGKYKTCTIYQRFESIKKNLSGVTYEDYLGIGAMVKFEDKPKDI